MKNVIWFISDQHRYHAVSSHGDTNVSTPNIDCLMFDLKSALYEQVNLVFNGTWVEKS